MIESVGPRAIYTSAPAAASTGQSSDKVIHQRSVTRVEPVEPTHPNAPTGPKPAFEHTFLEQFRAMWPKAPEAPELPEPEGEEFESPQPTQESWASLDFLRSDDAEDAPKVDIRR